MPYNSSLTIEVVGIMIEIYALKVDEKIEPERFVSLLKHAGEARQYTIGRLRKWEDAQRSLFSELLVRYIAADKISIGCSEVQFYKNQFGKPSIKNLSDFCFNVSHSGKWIVCAIDDEEIGIDIEEMCPIDLKVADRFFSKPEIREMQFKLSSQKLSYFYSLWTLKESYIKAWGKGLSIPLDSFSLKINSLNDIELKTSNAYKGCYFRQYDIDPAYKMAVCSLKSEFPDHVEEKNADELIKYFIRR